jgi:oligosaccharide repeat unit polymerase
LSYGLLAVGLLLFVAFLLDVGTTNYLLTTYADTYLIDRGRGHFRVGTVLAQTALVLLYGLSLVDRRSHAYRSVIVYSGYGLLVFFNLLIGRRGPIVELLLPTIVLHHYLAGRLAPRRIGSLLCLGLLAMLAFAYIRGLTSWDVPTLSGHISDESSLSWFDPSENEFGAPYKFVLPDLLDRVPRGLDYWWGRSYSDALQTLVPRMFFAGRVLTVGEWYAATFHAQEWALGFGYGFFVVGEAYLNFGLIGPPFIMFMYGVVLGAVYRRLIRERPGVFSVVVYSLVFVWAVIAMNADFAHQLKSICLMKLVPVSVVILLSSESDWRLDPPSTTPRALGRATGI